MECQTMIETVSSNDPELSVVVEPHNVQTLFRRVCAKKNTGPDSTSTLLLKTFAEELTPVWCPAFQQSVDSHAIPSLWKVNFIPVSKKPSPTEPLTYETF